MYILSGHGVAAGKQDIGNQVGNALGSWNVNLVSWLRLMNPFVSPHHHQQTTARDDSRIHRLNENTNAIDYPPHDYLTTQARPIESSSSSHYGSDMETHYYTRPQQQDWNVDMGSRDQAGYVTFGSMYLTDKSPLPPHSASLDTLSPSTPHTPQTPWPNTPSITSFSMQQQQQEQQPSSHLSYKFFPSGGPEFNMTDASNMGGPGPSTTSNAMHASHFEMGGRLEEANGYDDMVRVRIGLDNANSLMDHANTFTHMDTSAHYETGNVGQYDQGIDSDLADVTDVKSSKRMAQELEMRQVSNGTIVFLVSTQKIDM